MEETENPPQLYDVFGHLANGFNGTLELPNVYFAFVENGRFFWAYISKGAIFSFGSIVQFDLRLLFPAHLVTLQICSTDLLLRPSGFGGSLS